MLGFFKKCPITNKCVVSAAWEAA